MSAIYIDCPTSVSEGEGGTAAGICSVALCGTGTEEKEGERIGRTHSDFEV